MKPADRVFDVTVPRGADRDGARGDGKADDTAAIQAALDAAVEASGCVRIPAGRYRVTRTLEIRRSASIDIVGDGRSSALLHETPDHLLRWAPDAECRESTVRDLTIRAVGDKIGETAAIACLGGVARSLFSHLFITGTTGSGILTEKVCDTTTFEHCLMWCGVRGTGIRIARGSEVRVFGDRIIGRRDGVVGIGIHCVGDNGGVHVVTTDLIGLDVGLKIGEPGRKSNREIFVTHATMDGCRVGLWQLDNAYTSIAGCWAASSDDAQILLDETSGHAIVSISGGTIFNGGAHERGGDRHGLVVRAGSFMLTGVTVRHNRGTGILVDGDGVREYAITGCRIADNKVGAVLGGGQCAVTGNVFARNKRTLVDPGGDGDRVFAANAGVGEAG